MRWQALGLRLPVLLAALAMVCFGLLAGDVWAQATNNNTGGGNNNTGGGGGRNNNTGGGNNNNNNTNITGGQAGVFVDAQGVLRRNIVPDPTGMLRRQQVAAAQATLPRELARQSELRKVSLTRLEKALTANGGMMTDEMRYLAGLHRLQYVFLYPDSGDIVIAGPAEGWAAESDGRMDGPSFRSSCSSVAGSGSGPAFVPAEPGEDADGRLLDRSDPGRLGCHAAVPAIDRSLCDSRPDPVPGQWASKQPGDAEGAN